MSLADLMKKGSLRQFATATVATVATVATDRPDRSPSVASVATVSVAIAEKAAANDPADWRELAAAYHAHHFNCQTCIAAGWGSQYGQRCGTGTALWALYSATSAHPGEHLSIQKLGAHS